MASKHRLSHCCPRAPAEVACFTSLQTHHSVPLFHIQTWQTCTHDSPVKVALQLMCTVAQGAHRRHCCSMKQDCITARGALAAHLGC